LGAGAVGKTIEAGLVLSQRWAELKRRMLVITPSNLRKQRHQELIEKGCPSRPTCTFAASATSVRSTDVFIIACPVGISSTNGEHVGSYLPKTG